MPKKVRFESFKSRFLYAADKMAPKISGEKMPPWEQFVNQLKFEQHQGTVDISWKLGTGGKVSRSLGEPEFYVQRYAGPTAGEDPVRRANDTYFSEVAREVVCLAGYRISGKEDRLPSRRQNNERFFHDTWADGGSEGSIDVAAFNQACTAPEMRYIIRHLGNLKGKRLLDVGCGLGEASVYFALKGAEVISVDLSAGMTEATSRLAAANGVTLTTRVGTAEELPLLTEEVFDVIYAGNLLHHVDIERALSRFKRHLAADGVLVTWDPLAYNPAINVYRRCVPDLRTPDESPVTRRDIRSFERHFSRVETRFFWFTTLIIFVIMALIQRRDPNKERFWKAVVREGERWRWLYKPLEKFDSAALKCVPPLRWLCWNVVIFASAGKNAGSPGE